MTRNEFDGLYQVYLRCFTDKLKLWGSDLSTSYPVGSINKTKGTITLKTPDGIALYPYRSVIFPNFKELYGNESAQSLAIRINRNEKIYL